MKSTLFWITIARVQGEMFLTGKIIKMDRNFWQFWQMCQFTQFTINMLEGMYGPAGHSEGTL